MLSGQTGLVFIEVIGVKSCESHALLKGKKDQVPIDLVVSQLFLIIAVDHLVTPDRPVVPLASSFLEHLIVATTVLSGEAIVKVLGGLATGVI